MYDTLLLLFHSTSSDVEKFYAHSKARNQPIQAHDKKFDNVHVDDAMMRRDKKLYTQNLCRSSLCIHYMIAQLSQ